MMYGAEGERVVEELTSRGCWMARNGRLVRQELRPERLLGTLD
jgi:hypothetical protein